MTTGRPWRTVAGCDYSSKCVYLARVNKQRVEGISSILLPPEVEGRRTSYRILCSLLVGYHEIVEEHPIDKIWIEQPWVSAKFYPLSGLMMARSATYVETAAMLAGLEIGFMEPRTWRKVLFGTGAPKNPKEAAVKFVQEKFDYELPTLGIRKPVPDHNFAEAICIAYAGLISEEEK